MPFTPDELHELPNIFSAPRFATYLAEKGGDKVAALELYQWNLELSCCFLAPLQVCEELLSNLVFDVCWSCGDLIGLRHFVSVFELDAGEDLWQFAEAS